MSYTEQFSMQDNKAFPHLNGIWGRREKGASIQLPTHIINPRLLRMRSEGYCSRFVCVCLQRFKRDAGCKHQSRGTNAI